MPFDAYWITLALSLIFVTFALFFMRTDYKRRNQEFGYSEVENHAPSETGETAERQIQRLMQDISQLGEGNTPQ